MRAVWSLWTKPIREGGRRPWPSERAHWLSWVLSVETARRHYPELALVADSEGARILVEELGITFSDVSTELDALDGVDPAWWAIGKLYAYRAQRAPFVHVDADVFLWKRLPPIVEHAPVLAQSPEALTDHEFYEPDRVHALFERKCGGAPEPWTWYLRRGYQTAACCGILGGTDTEFLREYADLAIGVALDPRHRAVWDAEPDVDRHMVLIEQYLLCACVEHRRAHRGDRRDVHIQYLFPSASFERVDEVGFTHVIAGAKRNRAVIARIEEVVRRDHPALYKRAVDYAERASRREGAG